MLTAYVWLLIFVPLQCVMFHAHSFSQRTRSQTRKHTEDMRMFDARVHRVCVCACINNSCSNKMQTDVYVCECTVQRGYTETTDGCRCVFIFCCCTFFLLSYTLVRIVVSTTVRLVFPLEIEQQLLSQTDLLAARDFQIALENFSFIFNSNETFFFFFRLFAHDLICNSLYLMGSAWPESSISLNPCRSFQIHCNLNSMLNKLATNKIWFGENPIFQQNSVSSCYHDHIQFGCIF